MYALPGVAGVAQRDTALSTSAEGARAAKAANAARRRRTPPPTPGGRGPKKAGRSPAGGPPAGAARASEAQPQRGGGGGAPSRPSRPGRKREPAAARRASAASTEQPKGERSRQGERRPPEPARAAARAAARGAGGRSRPSGGRRQGPIGRASRRGTKAAGQGAAGGGPAGREARSEAEGPARAAGRARGRSGARARRAAAHQKCPAAERRGSGAGWPRRICAGAGAPDRAMRRSEGGEWSGLRHSTPPWCSLIIDHEKNKSAKNVRHWRTLGRQKYPGRLTEVRRPGILAEMPEFAVLASRQVRGSAPIPQPIEFYHIGRGESSVATSRQGRFFCAEKRERRG